jgi:hypothetical protein
MYIVTIKRIITKELLLAQVYGQQQTQRGSLQHLCVGTGQTGVCHWSDLCTPVRPVKVTG